MDSQASRDAHACHSGLTPEGDVASGERWQERRKAPRTQRLDVAELLTLGGDVDAKRRLAAIACTTMWCMNSRSLTIRLDEGLEQELEAACEQTGRSRGEIVRDALRRQLQLMRFEYLRQQALPFGEAAGWLTDDDVFAAIS